MAQERSGPAAGLFNASRRLLSTLLSAGETRLRLIIIELQEERDRFFSLLLMAFTALLLATFGLGMLILWVVVYFWETHRLLAIGGAAGVLLLLALLLALQVKSVASQPTLLRSTLARLSEDRDSVEGHIDEHRIGRRLDDEEHKR